VSIHISFFLMEFDCLFEGFGVQECSTEVGVVVGCLTGGQVWGSTKTDVLAVVSLHHTTTSRSLATPSPSLLTYQSTNF
jgi:hypothetical protein